jgi:predicted transcriptional regulator
MFFMVRQFKEDLQGAFLQKGIKTEADLEGGGLVTLHGRVHFSGHHKKPVLADERVSRTGEFVERFLKEKVEQKNLTQLERQHRMDEILHDYCSRTNTTMNEICGRSRVRHLSRIRSEIAHVLHKELGISYAEIARQLGISGVAVLKMMRRQ